MKITRKPTTGLPGIGIPGAVAEDAAPEPQAAGRPPDRVEISVEARLRAGLRSAIGQLEADPVARVAALRGEVESGAYHRDPVAIAERLLADVAGELLG